VRWRVAIGDDRQKKTDAIYQSAGQGHDERAVFVAGHGASGRMTDASMSAVAKAFRAHGFGVVRFDFLSTHMLSSMDVFRAVVARVRTELSPAKLVIGGRSFGGRVASMLAAEGFAADGLVLLSYPLHPPGQPEKLRDAHLPQIRMPVICFNGTRDEFCTPELMKRALATVTAPWEMRWLEGKDHGFRVTNEIAEACAEWLVRAR
jgi:predicted alpha/beta-hydrolase family hydrolase